MHDCALSLMLLMLGRVGLSGRDRLQQGFIISDKSGCAGPRVMLCKCTPARPMEESSTGETEEREGGWGGGGSDYLSALHKSTQAPGTQKVICLTKGPPGLHLLY